MADAIPFADLRFEVLRIEPLVVVSGPGHPLAGRSLLDASDLAGASVLLPKHDCSYKMVFEEMLTEANIDGPTFIALNSIEAIKQCAMQGVGVAMIPEMSVREEIARGKLIPLPWGEEKPETAVLMIWHKDKWISPTLQAFMDTAGAVMKSPAETVFHPYSFRRFWPERK